MFDCSGRICTRQIERKMPDAKACAKPSTFGLSRHEVMTVGMMPAKKAWQKQKIMNPIFDQIMRALFGSVCGSAVVI